MSIWDDTLVPPLITAVLYIAVFGLSIGSLLGEVDGLTYLEFIVPGLIIMSVINSAYFNTSFSLFISRWHGSVIDYLMSPITYFEMVLAITLGGVLRAVIVGIGVYLVGSIFTGFQMASFFYFATFLVLVSFTFSSLGILAALRAEQFDHITVVANFVLMPLIFTGGVFHSIKLIPPLFQKLTIYNPIFYMVNGFRYGMTGVADASPFFSLILLAVISVGLFLVTVELFRRGYKLKT